MPHSAHFKGPMTRLATIGARDLGTFVSKTFTVVRFASHVIAAATNDANLVPGVRHFMRRIRQELPNGREDAHLLFCLGERLVLAADWTEGPSETGWRARSVRNWLVAAESG